MALPNINETLKFQMKVPSTGKTVMYRPYLVKEEKILLQAFESKDPSITIQTIMDTINACVDDREEIDATRLATFDIEYMFTKLRAKSVGETSKIYMSCKECDETNEYLIDLEEIEIEVPEQNNRIQLNDSYAVELRYPTYSNIMTGVLEDLKKDPLQALKIIADNIVAIYTPSERIDASSETLEDLEKFVGSLTSGQIKELMVFFNTLPAMKKHVEFNCKKCGEHNELTLKGIADFF